MIDVETVSANLMEPVVAVDTDGVIGFANERFLSITQLARDEVLGADYRLLESFVEDGFDGFSAAVEAVARGDADRERVELSMLHPESAPVPRRLPARTRVSPIVEDGRRIGVLVVLRNIGELKQREQRLRRQNERLEEFASVVSHDLRNPLNVAAGRLDLAMDECDSEHLEDVARAHDRMAELIDGLLALARQGHATTEIEPVDLAAAFEDCWRNVETAGATLVTATDAVVRTEAGRLRQLLENLIRNSVEHGSTSRRASPDDAVEHGGGEVTVTVGDLDGGFYVEDDGPGIPADARERVLEPGYSTTDDGTGFGLAIVREIAEANGWDVAVTDGSDGGARFEFTGVDIERR